MFTSKRRNIVVPQSEHARFAGTIAAFWGNDILHGPPLSRDSFALGVISHDRGYGELDTLGIGQVNDEDWLEVQGRGIKFISTDPYADTVALMHIRRLIAGHDTESARRLLALTDARIDGNLELLGEDRETFRKADTITEACDMISFRYCFEEPMQFVQNVSSGLELCSIQIDISSEGRVTLEPWPLSVPELHGCLLAYDADGYPDLLNPVLLPFSVIPGSEI